MQHFELTPEELEILSDVLRHGIGEINIELYRTDTHDFKELLKHRKQVLEHLLDKFSAVQAAA